MDETASTAFHHHKLFRLIPDELKIKSSFLVVLCTEEWTNVFNIMSFQVNIKLNQVCVSVSMCVGTNEASWETNEEKADSKNSRQPATISKLTTQVLWLFFQAEKEKKSEPIVLKPLHSNGRMKEAEKLRKIKRPTARGLRQRAGREIFDYRIKTAARRETELDGGERMTQRTSALRSKERERLQPRHRRERRKYRKRKDRIHRWMEAEEAASSLLSHTSPSSSAVLIITTFL